MFPAIHSFTEFILGVYIEKILIYTPKKSYKEANGVYLKKFSCQIPLFHIFSILTSIFCV